jgi:hypothetical protein
MQSSTVDITESHKKLRSMVIEESLSTQRNVILNKHSRLPQILSMQNSAVSKFFNSTVTSDSKQ